MMVRSTEPFRQLRQQLAARREARESREAHVICPVDSWPFRPRYTEGRCPICGWEPPGAVVALPLSRRIDAFGWLVISLLALSLAMLALIITLYTRT